MPSPELIKSESKIKALLFPFERFGEAEMGVTKGDVEAALSLFLNPSHIAVIDTSGGCGTSFDVEIVSEKFEGKRLLERHRLVNAALAEQMPHIHALSIKKALTPSQWKPPQPENGEAAEN